jgi:AcrR family transcriptional regulator
MGTAAALDESRRQAILNAALETYLVKGVAGATIEDIKKHSGASVGCIYHHFQSKERLAAELYLEILSDYHSVFLDALRAATTAQDGVKGAIHSHFRWVARHPERASYLFHCREPEVAAAVDAGVGALNTAFYAEVATWLTGYADKKDIRALTPGLYHALWMGPSLEYARRWLADGGRRPALLSAGVETVAQAAWEVLRSEPSEARPPVSRREKRLEGRG